MIPGVVYELTPREITLLRIAAAGGSRRVQARRAGFRDHTKYAKAMRALKPRVRKFLASMEARSKCPSL